MTPSSPFDMCPRVNVTTSSELASSLMPRKFFSWPAASAAASYWVVAMTPRGSPPAELLLSKGSIPRCLQRVLAPDQQALPHCSWADVFCVGSLGEHVPLQALTTNRSQPILSSRHWRSRHSGHHRTLFNVSQHDGVRLLDIVLQLLSDCFDYFWIRKSKS